MVVASQKKSGKKSGRHTKQDWQRWRAIAWAHEVQRRAQDKMEQWPLPKADPFYQTAKLISAILATPQRQTQQPGIVTFMNLSEVLLGSKKTGYYKYAKGERAHVHPDELAYVESLLPGTLSIYEVGMNGVPIWAALEGAITPDRFWKPLIESGQVVESIESDVEWYDWSNNRKIAPPTDQVKRVDYDAWNVLPEVHWGGLAQSLAITLNGYSNINDGWKLMPIQQIRFGEAALAIGIAHLAIQSRGQESKKTIRVLLREMSPYWRAFDELLNQSFTGEVKEHRYNFSGYVAGLIKELRVKQL